MLQTFFIVGLMAIVAGSLFLAIALLGYVLDKRRKTPSTAARGLFSSKLEEQLVNMHQNIELPLPSSKRLWESPQEGFPLQYSSGAIFGWKENPDQGKGWELYQPSEYVGAGGPLFWLMNATHPNTPKDLQEALWASSEFETLCRWVLKDVDPELVAKRCDRHGGYYTPIVDLLRGCIQRGWVGGSR